MCELCGSEQESCSQAPSETTNLLVDFRCESCASYNEIDSSLPLVCEVCGFCHDGIERDHKIHITRTNLFNQDVIQESHIGKRRPPAKSSAKSSSKMNSKLNHLEILDEIGEKGEQEAMSKLTGSTWAQLSAIVCAFSTSLLELVCTCLCMFVCTILQTLNVAFVLIVMASVLLGELFIRPCLCRVYVCICVCLSSIAFCIRNVSGCLGRCAAYLLLLCSHRHDCDRSSATRHL